MDELPPAFASAMRAMEQAHAQTRLELSELRSSAALCGDLAQSTALCEMASDHAEHLQDLTRMHAHECAHLRKQMRDANDRAEQAEARATLTQKTAQEALMLAFY